MLLRRRAALCCRRTITSVILSATRCCASTSSSSGVSIEVQQWLLDAQASMHSLEVASTTSSSSGQLTPHEEHAKAQSLMTTAAKVTTFIEGLLQSPASYPIAKAASTILISGSDMKAMIPSGSLSSLVIEKKDMSRVDYTGMSFVDTQCNDCDLSRSIMMRVAFHQSRFVNCTFDGSIFKANSVKGQTESTVFVGCSFKFCMMDVSELQVLHPVTGSVTPPQKWDRACVPLFFDCDFEFSDVKSCAPCSWMFRNCRGVPAFDIDAGPRH
ncbi:Hypothetical protein, putative [Bodo saltans]|uniref:Uncharacterized protein n=1 Tax=Bodo saltans TaxID=75058 RepID=A0A0S4JLY2_BODSA|nr:Hypothetical protein, putative [Bodo saltans]|eukprot:CUG90285.1 Hypothetical protein, putative [Bodo saltans]